ncbi:MAG: cell division protein SepF [Oscillospiraceae bacterium]|nr:cell division protein SepF [Oscillospiraceae bacterium]
MGFMDELRKLTQPYEDEDDFYEGSEYSADVEEPSEEQLEFESNFSDRERPEREDDEEGSAPRENKGIFSGRSRKKTGRSRVTHKERVVDFGGTEQQVILFNPKTFDEAGDLAGYLSQGRSVVLTLEGIPMESARRLLDFLSGISFALQGKITPISAKTYFVTPQNVDILGAPTYTAGSDSDSAY